MFILFLESEQIIFLIKSRIYFEYIDFFFYNNFVALNYLSYDMSVDLEISFGWTPVIAYIRQCPRQYTSSSIPSLNVEMIPNYILFLSYWLIKAFYWFFF
jgi:hypothetical protein